MVLLLIKVVMVAFVILICFVENGAEFVIF